MTFDDYQKQAPATLVRHPDPLMNKTILAMGVAGEAGEVLEKWKKIVAYKDGIISDEDLGELGKELADVIWYIAVLADELVEVVENLPLPLGQWKHAGTIRKRKAKVNSPAVRVRTPNSRVRSARG